MVKNVELNRDVLVFRFWTIFVTLILIFVRLLPRTCQMMFFSATYETAVMEFAEIIVSNPLIIRLLKEEESLDNIKQYFVKCKNMDEKYNAITNIYGTITIGQAIIFCHVIDANKYFSIPFPIPEKFILIIFFFFVIDNILYFSIRQEKPPAGWPKRWAKTVTP